MNTQQHKKIIAFESTEGDQINYYFTDAKPELAEAEAKKKAVKHFNSEDAKVTQVDNEFQGIPETVPELYTWFVGSKDMFATTLPLEETLPEQPEQPKEHAKPSHKEEAKPTAKKAAKKK